MDRVRGRLSSVARSGNRIGKDWRTRLGKSDREGFRPGARCGPGWGRRCASWRWRGSPTGENLGLGSAECQDPDCERDRSRSGAGVVGTSGRALQPQNPLAGRAFPSACRVRFAARRDRAGPQGAMAHPADPLEFGVFAGVSSRSRPWHRHCSTTRVRGRGSRPTIRACHLQRGSPSAKSSTRMPVLPGPAFAFAGERARVRVRAARRRAGTALQPFGPGLRLI